jgi:hypothetical protein
MPRLHGEGEELTRVQFRASPEAEEQHGDRAMAVKRRQRRCLVRAVLRCGEKRRGVGRGAVRNGVLVGAFNRAGEWCQDGEGGGNGR